MTGLCEHKHMFDATPWLVIYPAKLIIFRFFFGWTSICHFCLQTIRGQLTLRTFVGFSRRLNPIFDHVKISMVFGRCKKWHQRGLDRPIIFADFRRRYRTLTPLDWWIDHLDHIMWFVENMKSLIWISIPQQVGAICSLHALVISITVSRFGSVGVFILGQTCWYFKLCYCLRWWKYLQLGPFFLKYFYDYFESVPSLRFPSASPS